MAETLQASTKRREQVEHDLQRPTDTTADPRSFRVVPSPNLIGCLDHQRKGRRVLCAALMAPLPVVAGLAQDAMHGAHRAPVNPALSQRVIDLHRRLIATLIARQDRVHPLTFTG
ncbi:MAG: hypothetical protein GKR94_27750 [Gammaproteobacteria bacterium]|nr:hypothetical protein [Gammaproteobacteria bacterium]NKC15855.1 hypothetical protein [Gammaproteobacteria bacterium]